MADELHNKDSTTLTALDEATPIDFIAVCVVAFAASV
jgi:hypothetical protein